MEKREVTVAMFYAAIELIGSVASYRQSKRRPNVKAFATQFGIELFNGDTKRTVCIPYANVKCYEVTAD